MKPASFLLMKSLGLNAVFSGVSAVVMLVAADWIALQLGLGGTASVYFVAVFLLVFAAQLGAIVRNGVIRNWEIVSIIVGDLAWVAASIVLVAIYHESITTIGIVLVDAVALVVLTFALLQMRGLNHYNRDAYG